MSNNESMSFRGGAEKSTSEHHLFVDNILLRAETLPKGEPETFGATPLDRVATLSQQLELATSLQVYTLKDIPETIPLDIIDYIHRTFLKRFHGRAEANEENYTTSLTSKEAYADSPKLQKMFQNTEVGSASPTEILLTRQLLGIRSAELACLTHPYGSRIEMLDEMRSAVKTHVEGFGGTYYQNPETRYRVKEIIWNESDQLDTETEKQMRGLLMTRKRILGQTLDGTIIRERSSFVLRTDPDGVLSEDERSSLSQVELKSKTWQDDLVKAAHLDEIAALFLEENEYSLAIPISSTIYAYNLETTQLVEEKIIQERAKRREAFARTSPMLAAAAWGGRLSEEGVDLEFGDEANRSHIYYVGPEHK